MTVKELIEKLNIQDPTKVVIMEDYYGNSHNIEEVHQNLYDDVVIMTKRHST